MLAENLVPIWFPQFAPRRREAQSAPKARRIRTHDAHGRRRGRRRCPATTPTGTCGSREIQVDAQAIVLLSRHFLYRHLARRVSHHVSSGASAAPDVLVAYIRSAGPIVGAPYKDGKPSEKECSENGCKRASKSGCCGFRRSSGGEGSGDGFKLLELLTQDEDSLEKKADAGITHCAAPTHGVCGRRASSDWRCGARLQGYVGAPLRAQVAMHI